jgi:hypothetical protein
VNDCKTHLTEDEFLSLCKLVIAHRGRENPPRRFTATN